MKLLTVTQVDLFGINLDIHSVIGSLGSMISDTDGTVLVIVFPLVVR